MQLAGRRSSAGAMRCLLLALLLAVGSGVAAQGPPGGGGGLQLTVRDDAWIVAVGSTTDLSILDTMDGPGNLMITNCTQSELFVYGGNGSTVTFTACPVAGINRANACARYKAPDSIAPATLTKDTFTCGIIDTTTNRTAEANLTVRIVLPPTARNDAYTVPDLRGTYNFTPLANDDDINGLALRITELGLLDGGASADPVGRGLTYDVVNGTNGKVVSIKLMGAPIVLNYTTSNGGAFASANISITGAALPPPVSDDTAVVLVGTSTYLRVLRNDVERGIYVNISDISTPALARPISGSNAVLVTECPLLDEDRWPLNCILYTAPPTLLGGATSADDAFTYTVSDIVNGASSTARVAVKVVVPPTAKDDVYYNVDLGGSREFFVLDNDFDPNGLLLTIADVAVPEDRDVVVDIVQDGSALSVQGDGVELVLNYTISNGLASDSATVTITDSPPPPPPAVKADEYFVTAGSKLLLPVLANDERSGAGLNIVRITPTDLAAQGLSDIKVVPCTVAGVTQPSGCIEYTAPSEPAQDAFTYVVRKDASGTTGEGDVFITVVAPPDAKDDTYTIRDRRVRTLAVLANDVDTSGRPIQITNVTPSSPARGFSVAAAAGGITFTPPLTGGRGKFSFKYTITNVASGQDTATVTVTFAAPDATCANINKSCKGTPVRTCNSKRFYCVANAAKGHSCQYASRTCK